jgi:hypothetical protein
MVLGAYLMCGFGFLCHHVIVERKNQAEKCMKPNSNKKAIDIQIIKKTLQQPATNHLSVLFSV